ncbi:MAG: tyrosine-protein phosphatase, partial [Pseudomonadota bacterium]
VAEHAERFAVMFDQIIKGNVPLTFNCSAGKDRTGIAAALLLTALDVPRETILADYAMSEKVVDYMAEFTSTDIPADHPYYFLTQLPKAMVAPLMRSDPRYLQSAFASIEAKHGSVMAFIQTELGVDDGELAALRASLLK